jgi:hypothetical protein
MSLSKSEPSNQNPLPGLSHGCPFLGLKVDPETHFSSPSPGNYCHKVNPSEPISVPHQEEFCLGGKYSNCIIFHPGWKGSLPSSIRGDGSSGLRSNKKTKVVVAGTAIATENKNLQVGSQPVTIPPSHPLNEVDQPLQVEKIDDTLNQINRDDENDIPWVKLYGEASQKYQESSGNNFSRKDRYIWIGLFLIATIIFAVSIWGVLDRITKLRTSTELSMLSARTVNAITASFETAVSGFATSTANAIFLSSGISKDEATPTPVTVESEILTDTPTYIEPTATTISCDDYTGYQIEIISGPELSPRPGYVYQEGSPEPVVQAKWVIKNPGSCKWEQIVLQETTTGENFVPLLFQGNEVIDLSNLEEAINPGEEFTLAINFKLKDVKSVNRDWVIILNGFPLLEQPHIILMVENWINIIQAQSTPTKSGSSSTKPTATGNPSRETSEPPTRPPSTPPTRAP